MRAVGKYHYVVCLGIGLLGLSPAALQAYSINTTSNGALYHWPQHTIFINVQGPPQPSTAFTHNVVRALSTWRQSRHHAALHFKILKTAPAPNQPVINVVWQQQWTYEHNALAVTIHRVRASSGQLASVTIHINAAKCFRHINCDEQTGFDLQTVLLHELGHALGLGHSRQPSSVMYPYLPAGEQRLALSHDDAFGAWFISTIAMAAPPQVGTTKDAMRGEVQAMADGVQHLNAETVSSIVLLWCCLLALGVIMIRMLRGRTQLIHFRHTSIRNYNQNKNRTRVL